MELGNIKPIEITDELKDSYLDYAMSVIVGRALPDVRDGLKPVHRRILYAMWDMGLRSNAKLRKSATVVGETLGKYHPHGDMAVYDTLVRLAQDFSMRYPLIQGQGNFGSIDGDAPAAMRYTECRLTPLAEEMLIDIDKDTVNWIDNYDGTRQEPTVLPARLPQLLLNGSLGIAVGMATSIPPHNLTELVDGLVHLIDHPKATTEDLLKFIKGPDFPTGGAIYDRSAITQAYSTGKGGIINRGIAKVEETKKGNFYILITEIPYQVNKANLLEKIAELVKEKKLEGIKDIRDESSREGMRVVIELKSEAYPQKILNRLYKLTDLQKTFHLNLLALTDGLQPQVLPLKDILGHYISHRKEVVTRRTQFDLKRARERAHVLEGLKKALDHIDAIISTIKKSATKEEAHKNLCVRFKFSDAQASAILEMRLQALAGLERQKIEDELKEKLKLIKELEAILKDARKVLEVIGNELSAIKEKYGDERKTKVFVSPIGEFKEEDLVPQEECIITLTQGGYIKRINPKNYKAQKRGGKGMIGMTTREEDAVKYLAVVSTHDNLLFFTNTGRVFQTKAYEIGEGSRVARGQAIVNFLQLAPGERVTALVPAKESFKNLKKNTSQANNQSLEDNFLVMATKNGIIKKTEIEDFANVRRSGLIAITLKKGDELRWARATSGQDEIILVTAKGQSIHFKEKDVRPMGRSAAGVKGILIKKDDELVSMEIIDAKWKIKNARLELLVVAQNGYGKKTDVKQFKVQHRGGSGIKAAQVTSKTGKLVIAKILEPDEQDLIAMSDKGQTIRIALSSVSLLGRATQGVRIMKLEPGDKVATITCI
ncbi:MAG: DNA gyrase subunit A [Candidatus Portnoybacteria bacterium RBG_19FT_COMBO_36_7]|uniref:DNA gyrase subunit A n=1 Tax=Candidatus Portnoybacteria bacterium RBG_19FT_COMBO_36_7 TaxID=1801992 RepID=A0A1G2F7C7_9BACT|nr:MAG: DNA gyrase subunit A [Candidatus Portnoybacteria bacterium RBG_19FT_COMBO_36_7]